MTFLSKLLGRRVPDPESQGPLYADVASAMLDVQAYARSHGGKIELVGVDGAGDVTVRFRGACAGCPMSAVTLRIGIEDRLRALVPGIRKVHSS